MSDPIKLRLGDRTIWIVRPQDVEHWPEAQAAGVLREAAEEWPARDALLQLADDMHGAADGLAPALAFLASALDRGTLVAVRLPDRAVGLAGLGDDADRWDDAPRLSDLADDPPAGRKDGPGGVEPGRSQPVVPEPWIPGAGGSDVVDPAATFVAFAVFDQHGRPLAGSSQCTVDGGKHGHALDGKTIEIRPIGPHATIELVLAELRADADARAQ